MVLQEDVRTSADMLLVAKGTQISYALLARLRNFLRRDPIAGTVLVHVPHLASAGPLVLPKANEAVAGPSIGKS
jgi:hypothetical protein